MRILSINNETKLRKNYPKPSVNYIPKYNLKNQTSKDVISFGVSKYKLYKLDPINVAICSVLNSPIEKFNSATEFNQWCEKKLKNSYCENELEKIYIGKHERTAQERRKIIKEWQDFMDKENISSNLRLYLMYFLTKDLNNTTDRIPLPFSQEVFETTIKRIGTIKQNRIEFVNFNNEYQTDLIKYYTKELENDKEQSNTKTGWITIPSKLHDKNGFSENVKKLQAISAKKWSTKSFPANDYLSDGDFYIFIDKSKPVIGIKTDYGLVVDVQGEANDDKIPAEYKTFITDLIFDKDLEVDSTIEYRLKRAI